MEYLRGEPLSARLEAGRSPVHGDDVWMVDPRQDPRFALEALDSRRCRELWPDDLDRDGSIEQHVAREEDAPHAPGAELTLDLVLTCECGAQLLDETGH